MDDECPGIVGVIKNFYEITELIFEGNPVPHHRC